jgi:hypothetical protein
MNASVRKAFVALASASFLPQPAMMQAGVTTLYDISGSHIREGRKIVVA